MSERERERVSSYFVWLVVCFDQSALVKCRQQEICTGQSHCPSTKLICQYVAFGGPVCATNMDGCVPACKGKVSSSAADCRSLPEGTKCSSSYVVIVPWLCAQEGYKVSRTTALQPSP